MKQMLAMALATLLLSGMLVPSVLAAEEPIPSSGTQSESTANSGGVTDGSNDTAAITLTAFDEPYRVDAVAFPVGASQEELIKWFADTIAGFTAYDADGNYHDLISGAWVLDAVDTSKVGVYYAWTAPALGAEYTLGDGVTLPRQLCAVSIQATGKPDINCCVAGRGFLHFPWMLTTEQEEQLDEFSVWLRQDNEEWTQMSEGFLFNFSDLQLSQRIFKYQSTYELKVAYPGGQTGVLSFQYDGQLSILDYSGGDRDGGDAGGSDSGTGTQPPPQTPNDSDEDDNTDSDYTLPSHDDASKANEILQNIEPPVQNKVDNLGKPVHTYAHALLSANAEFTSPVPRSDTVPQAIPDGSNAPSEPDAVLESYSRTKTVISSMRLRDLCADGESVVFGSGDLTVSIPSNLLLALNLSNSDTLSVMLTQPEDNQVSLAVEVSERSVTEITGAVVRLRFVPQSENAEITVLNEAGEQITSTSYDGEFLRFTTNAAGTYEILEVIKTQKTQKNMLPLLTVSGGMTLAAGGVVNFWRRRHG